MAVAASEVCSNKHCATSTIPNAAVEVATIVVIVAGVIYVVFVASCLLSVCLVQRYYIPKITELN